MKNILEVINRKLDDAKECINKLEDTIVEITITEKRIKRNEDSLRDLWDKIKCTDHNITDFTVRKDRE